MIAKKDLFNKKNILPLYAKTLVFAPMRKAKLCAVIYTGTLCVPDLPAKQK